MKRTSFPKDLHAAAIYMAQVYGDAEMEKMLWHATDDVNAKVDDYDHSLMHIASDKGYAPLLKLLHQAKASLDIKDNVGWTPMMKAARSGHLPCLQFLVEQGAKIEYMDDGLNRSSLRIAAINGHLPCVKFLVEQGAKFEYMDNGLNRSCLMEAAYNGHTNVVSYLMDAGANVDTVDWKGRTPLAEISSNKTLQSATVMRLLLDHGANIDAQDNFGWTALINAMLAENTDAVKLLLENGANTMIRDNENQTALDIATHRTFDEIANLIRHHDEQNAVSNCHGIECAP
jgi:ankyrin repeat protein